MTISRIGNTVDVTTPAWLYELLPLIYIFAGFLVAAQLSGMLATFSGILLIAAGAHVLRMRNRYRKSLRHPRRVQIRRHA